MSLIRTQEDVLVETNHVKQNISEAQIGSSSNQIGTAQNRKGRYRSLPGQTKFVTLTLTHDIIKNNRQGLPLLFMKNNCMTEPGLIEMVGKDGSKTLVHLRRDSKGRMRFGKGWREFVFANSLKIGQSFTLEAVWEESTPMLKLSTMGSKNDNKMIKERCTSSTTINNQIVILKLTHKVLRDSTLILPDTFVRANGIEKLGKIGFVGQDNSKWWGHLLSRTGIIAVGIGWGNFCKSNGVNEEDSFSLEYLPQDQDKFPVLKFSPNL